MSTDLAVAMVLDKSSSMIGLTPSVISGFNEYVDGLREQEGETFFSLTLFDTDFVQPYIGVPLDEVLPLTDDLYRAHGNTALYDAIAFTVKKLEQRLKKEGRADMKVLVVTMTDGQENSSTDFDAAGLAALVREYEAKGNWTFVYLGLGQTQAYVGSLRGFGYVGENGYFPVASAAGVSHSMANLATATSTHRHSDKSSSKNIMADAGLDVNAGSEGGIDLHSGAGSAGVPLHSHPGGLGGSGSAGNTTTYKESSLLDHLGGGN